MFGVEISGLGYLITGLGYLENCVISFWIAIHESTIIPISTANASVRYFFFWSIFAPAVIFQIRLF